MKNHFGRIDDLTLVHFIVTRNVTNAIEALEGLRSCFEGGPGDPPNPGPDPDLVVRVINQAIGQLREIVGYQERHL
jgi:hypothetical protein